MRKNRVGAVVVAATPILSAGLWLLFPPANDGRPDFARQVLGEFLGSTAVLLFAVALLLATRARFLEPYFGGLDRMYRHHRRSAQVGFLLLLAHVALVPWTLDSPGGTPSGLIAFAGLLVLVLLTVGPRLPLLRRVITLGYQRWKWGHKFIGLFFVFAMPHAMLVDTVVSTMAVPFALLLAAYVAGIAAYGYTLVFARFLRPTRRYVVETVRRLNGTTVEVSLRPRGRKRVAFTSGQFGFVRFHRPGLREWHPFTLSGSPADPLLRLTIKTAGDYTRRVYDGVESGCRATVEGGYGMFDYRRGGQRQIWVAGGIGVTPFLSWLRDPEPAAGRTVDLFYTVRHPEDALFWAEIRAAVEGRPHLRAHLNVSAQAGSLTVARIAATAGPLDGAHVYLCGPLPMTSAFQRELRRLGLPDSSVHAEDFHFR